MTIKNPNRAMLLINITNKKMYPFSKEGLKYGSGSWSKLISKTKNDYIFDIDGSIRKIDQIKLLNPYGSTNFSRIINFILKNWTLDVTLSDPINISIGSLKNIIIDCLPNSVGLDSNWLKNESHVGPMRDVINSSDGFIELFNSLNLPPPENCLDAL